MSKKPWPFYLFQHTPEQIAEYERLADLAEKGLLKTRPLNPKEREQMKRFQASPTSASIIEKGPESFLVEMRCRCGAEESFDETASQPWEQHRDNFHKKHEGC